MQHSKLSKKPFQKSIQRPTEIGTSTRTRYPKALKKKKKFFLNLKKTLKYFSFFLKYETL